MKKSFVGCQEGRKRYKRKNVRGRVGTGHLFFFFSRHLQRVWAVGLCRTKNAGLDKRASDPHGPSFVVLAGGGGAERIRLHRSSLHLHLHLCGVLQQERSSAGAGFGCATKKWRERDDLSQAFSAARQAYPFLSGMSQTNWNVAHWVGDDQGALATSSVHNARWCGYALLRHGALPCFACFALCKVVCRRQRRPQTGLAISIGIHRKQGLPVNRAWVEALTQCRSVCRA